MNSNIFGSPQLHLPELAVSLKSNPVAMSTQNSFSVVDINRGLLMVDIHRLLRKTSCKVICTENS